MSDEGMSDAPRYLLIKRGLYYRPNNQGYTGKRSEAGRYPETDADDMSGVTAVHEDNAAEYAPACWQETINQDLRERLDAAERERDALREALQETDDFIERVNLDEQICCSGHDCGCRGSTQRDYLLHNIRAALTANHSAPVVEQD